MGAGGVFELEAGGESVAIHPGHDLEVALPEPATRLRARPPHVR